MKANCVLVTNEQRSNVLVTQELVSLTLLRPIDLSIYSIQCCRDGPLYFGLIVFRKKNSRISELDFFLFSDSEFSLYFLFRRNI